MLVGVCVVNYKTPELTIECLRSIAEECRLDSLRVVVVDNDSQDGSFDKINLVVNSEGWAEWITVINSKYNGGFAYGNNIALRYLLNQELLLDYFYLLNPDTRLLNDVVGKLVQFLEENAKVGIAGSRIVDSEGKSLNSMFKFHSLLTEINRGFSFKYITMILRPWLSAPEMPACSVKTEWVSGASMMVRRSVIDDIGLLDEAYFMYFEETDFCLNAAKAGWECWYVPDAKIVHLVAQSSGINTAQTMQKRMPGYWFESRRRYFLKNHGRFMAILADLLWLIGFSSFRVRNFIQKKQTTFPPHLLWDGFVNSVFLKGFKLLPIKNK